MSLTYLDAAVRVLDDAGRPLTTKEITEAAILQRALTGARTADADAAYGHLERARAVADRLGEPRPW